MKTKFSLETTFTSETPFFPENVNAGISVSAVENTSNDKSIPHGESSDNDKSIPHGESSDNDRSIPHRESSDNGKSIPYGESADNDKSIPHRESSDHTDTSAQESGGLKQFAEELRQALLLATGMEPERIRYKKADDCPPSNGDRLLVDCEKSGGYTEVCGLYVEDLYESRLSGVSMEQLISAVLKQLKNVKDSNLMKKMEQLHSYEAIKEDLFIRPVNLDRHKKKLNNAVYRVIGDIALVLYMRIGEIDHCPTNMKLPKNVAENWNMDMDKIFCDVLLNTSRISPPRIFFWEKLIFDEDYDGEDFMNPLSNFQLRKDAVGNCLSTSSRCNGAIAVFLPGVAQRLCELLGHGFYMAFTSIHEVMVHNDTQVEPEELREVLKDTVRETTPEEDFLSLNIYHYDKDTHIFSVL